MTFTKTLSWVKLPPDMYECRKLSVTFLLNEPGVDFEGGDFQINSGERKNVETIPLNEKVI